ncbi:chemotaxis protein CheB [Sphingomonas sp. ac-8]|uniref:chemotaxis protein CheB n=1 Tax=Sphingomonas sp. ac-8 TaxID=3242977 RepID=UPI003A7FD649
MEPRPIRVMIVEDSLVVRTLLSHIVAGDPRLEVAAAVASAEEALAQLAAIRPDVISMDIRLPGMDGLEATRQIMAEQPTPIVVISASFDRTQLNPTMDALRAGALAAVEKPVGVADPEYRSIAQEIRTQLTIMSQVAVVRRRMRGTPTSSPTVGRPRVQPRVLLCAASTGGPQALARLFAGLPAELPLPVLLVQHMGGAFMEGFAQWLDSVVPQQVELARIGVMPQPGTIYVAPGDRHLTMMPSGKIALSDAAPIGGQRPAATVLFGSAAAALDGAALAVVLTGMGDDGAAGVRQLVEAGGAAIAEHESSAVVNGMPAAAVRQGALALPLDLIAPHLRRLMARERVQ